MEKNIKFKITYYQGEANNNRLDMYDASASLQGFAKALAITTHALLNDGQIRKRAHSIEGAKLYISPSRKGSFQELITLCIESGAISGIGYSVIAATFYDLLKWTWAKTLGKEHVPETTYVKKLAQRKEPFISEMEDALETVLEEAHRPIKSSKEMYIVLERPKEQGGIIRLDYTTLQNVKSTIDPKVMETTGNVTRFNILTGYGRFYDDGLGKTVSFTLDESVEGQARHLVTWSMNAADRTMNINDDTPIEGKIILVGKKVMSAKGQVKRYLISNVKHIQK